MTKTKHTSLFIGLAMLFLGAGATANAADATVYQTFIGGVNGNWNPTYFNLDKSQIAKGLGLTESELLEKAGTDVIVYSVKSDGTEVAPNSKYAANGNYQGDWHDANGYSTASSSNAGGFYHVVNYTDFSLGYGQNPNVVKAVPKAYNSKYVVKYGDKTVDVNIAYKVESLTDVTQAGDYSVSLPYGNTGFACSYVNIDNAQLATALGLTEEELATAYVKGNTGTVTVGLYDNYDSKGKFVASLSGYSSYAADGAFNGSWLNKGGHRCKWDDNPSVFFVYDPAGRIGIAQMPTTQNKSNKVAAGDRIYFPVLFYNKNNGKYASVNIYYNVTDQNYVLKAADTDFYSLYLDFATTIPEGIEAYTGTVDNANSKVVLTKIEDGIIPAKTAVLVKASAAGEYTFNMTTGGTATSDLSGVISDTKASLLKTDGKKVLEFGIKNGVTGFRQPADETNIKANKAYILVDEANTSTAKSYTIVMDNTTAVKTVKTVDTVENGAIYNVAGQRIGKNAKGLIISNGKVYIK